MFRAPTLGLKYVGDKRTQVVYDLDLLDTDD